jgi:hypothetical protein
MLKTITLYSTIDNSFGAILTGTEEELGTYLSIPHIDGAYDNKIYKYDPRNNTAILREVSLVDKPLLHELRNKRDELLEGYRWTIMPDSPLANNDEWLVYLQALQALLKGVTAETTDQVVWPEKPQYIYA